MLFIRDSAEPDRKRKRAPEDKSKNVEEEKRREEAKGKDAEAKEPEAKKKKQSKDDVSSSSDDEEVNLVNLRREACYYCLINLQFHIFHKHTDITEKLNPENDFCQSAKRLPAARLSTLTASKVQQRLCCLLRAASASDVRAVGF